MKCGKENIFVAVDALVLKPHTISMKHQAISTHNTDSVTVVLENFHKNDCF